MNQKEFYKSQAWKRCRANYIRSRDGLCERCLAAGIYKPGKVVHHRVHLTDDNVSNPTVSLNPENLELLCQDCHNAEHHSTVQRRFRFGVDGSLTIIAD